MKKIILLSLLLVSATAFSQTVRKVTVNNTSTLILDLNIGRAGFTLYNPTDTVYVKFGVAVTDTVWTLILCQNGFFMCTKSSCGYIGKVTAKTASGTKYLEVTEY